MRGSNAGKLALLVGGVVLANVILLSPGLAGFTVGGGDALQTAVGVTVLAVSLLVVLYGSYSLLFVPEPKPAVTQLEKPEDYVLALQHYRSVQAVREDVALALEQVDRMKRKQAALEETLGQRFDAGELSYQKFIGAIREVERLFYRNIRGMLTKLGAFDETEMERLSASAGSKRYSGKLLQEKAALFQEYLTHISGYGNANEEILLKLDRLILELSKLDGADYAGLEEMPGMVEIDALIQQTKHYK
ncbi:hypothetical protein [Gorillibacterium sp. sgz500922]|uniref:hypothetical protein n=1 Tax=Gorillibacterium sp. sgz500922 TaxID=3446694 RepID=UPI003F6809AD